MEEILNQKHLLSMKYFVIGSGTCTYRGDLGRKSPNTGSRQWDEIILSRQRSRIPDGGMPVEVNTIEGAFPEDNLGEAEDLAKRILGRRIGDTKLMDVYVTETFPMSGDYEAADRQKMGWFLSVPGDDFPSLMMNLEYFLWIEPEHSEVGPHGGPLLSRFKSAEKAAEMYEHHTTEREKGCLALRAISKFEKRLELTPQTYEEVRRQGFTRKKTFEEEMWEALHPPKAGPSPNDQRLARSFAKGREERRIWDRYVYGPSPRRRRRRDDGDRFI